MAETVAAGSGPPWGICYHAQQAIKKALIAAAGEDPPRTHNLARPNIAIAPAVFDGSDDGMLASLTLWAIQLSVGGKPAQQMRAEIAGPAERARLWPIIATAHRNFAGYQG